MTGCAVLCAMMGGCVQVGAGKGERGRKGGVKSCKLPGRLIDTKYMGDRYLQTPLWGSGAAGVGFLIWAIPVNLTFGGNKMSLCSKLPCNIPRYSLSTLRYAMISLYSATPHYSPPYDSLWYPMIFHDVPRYTMIFHAISRHCKTHREITMFHGIPRYVIIPHDVLLSSLTSQDGPWYFDIPSYSTIYHDIPFHSVTFQDRPWYHATPRCSTIFLNVPWYSIMFSDIPKQAMISWITGEGGHKKYEL